ncbi:MAG: TetR/AcrR family transcriptional regulator [Acetobacteraceae bacterium]
MKVSSDKVAAHRTALLETAKRLLNERGFDGAAVAEISRAAGLTQGALYGQFKSKNALAAEAIRKSFAEGAAIWDELREKEPDALAAFLDAYLCEEHAKDPGAGCTLAACVSEIGRQDPAIGAAYAEGFRRLADTVQAALPAEIPAQEARSRAVTLLAGMVGGLSIARAVEKSDPELSRGVLMAVREELARLARSPACDAVLEPELKLEPGLEPKG